MSDQPAPGAVAAAGPGLVGQPVPRVEDARLLCGLGRYVDDLPDGQALHMALVRSDQPHARITAIDARLADASTVPDAGPSAFEIVSAPTNDVAVGYVDSSGANTAVLFDNHNRAAQCRSGHVPEVDQLAYSDCPTPDGLG